jgi:hypothetical protein
MLEITGTPPYAEDICALVVRIAEEALEMGDIDQLKVFWYFDDGLDQTARDVLFQAEPFDVWFEPYFSDNAKYWHASRLIVYSDTVEGRDELRFHVVLGDDLPVYALCVNRTTRQAQWYLQETPVASALAAKRK